MPEQEQDAQNALEVSARVENANIIAEAKIDVIEALRQMAKRSDNTIDDNLVNMVAMARDNMDWKGVSKEYNADE